GRPTRAGGVTQRAEPPRRLSSGPRPAAVSLFRVTPSLPRPSSITVWVPDLSVELVAGRTGRAAPRGDRGARRRVGAARWPRSGAGGRRHARQRRQRPVRFLAPRSPPPRYGADQLGAAVAAARRWPALASVGPPAVLCGDDVAPAAVRHDGARDRAADVYTRRSHHTGEPPTGHEAVRRLVISIGRRTGVDDQPSRRRDAPA